MQVCNSCVSSMKSRSLIKNGAGDPARLGFKIHTYPSTEIPFLFSQGILERLNAGEVVIGDGGFVFALEKRGYVKAGPWTPEATKEHPEAGKNEALHTFA